ncbi:RNA polymerase sigma factor [Mucilaginibacter sp. X5P1]|uniref:RNA polymerase sigma factor n=1 Tax=Mucilaginibacter sp. X5P1 TaxID=2723088 RepID=UPI0016216EF1|nr:RNA polymerase sigma-70 factor [Mucilaginibacter sp. X5P1]MBB6141463.1 RNA polymerase sigma-70 factor (ECF subfamily) [Mucilaginibacter sp. X5P1]
MLKYNPLTDQQLASLLKDGDHGAYKEIYNRYTGILYRHAFAKLQDREEAKDIVQELFITLWDKYEQIDFQTNLAGYLYRMLQNRILNLIAHKKVASQYIDSLQEFIDYGEAITDHLVRINDLKDLIEREIAGLPDKMREVFELSRKSYLSHKEIAEKLDISEKTVKNQINGALKILRKKLGVAIFFLFV